MGERVSSGTGSGTTSFPVSGPSVSSGTPLSSEASSGFVVVTQPVVDSSKISFGISFLTGCASFSTGSCVDIASTASKDNFGVWTAGSSSCSFCRIFAARRVCSAAEAGTAESNRVWRGSAACTTEDSIICAANPAQTIRFIFCLLIRHPLLSLFVFVVSIVFASLPRVSGFVYKHSHHCFFAVEFFIRR